MDTVVADFLEKRHLRHYTTALQRCGVKTFADLGQLTQKQWRSCIPDARDRGLLRLEYRQYERYEATLKQVPVVDGSESVRGESLRSLSRRTILDDVAEGYISTDIPCRLDRLPWSRYHLQIVVSLGIAWILDGFIVSVVGLSGAQLSKKETLDLNSFQVGLFGGLYIGGCVLGSMTFGYLADHWGRKRLFAVVPCVYLAAAITAGFMSSFYPVLACMFVIGFGIGGEYSAINSAINEFVPADVRGTVDMVINGYSSGCLFIRSYWIGAMAGSASTLAFYDADMFAVNLGWRLPFWVAGALGIGVIIARLFIPESPRWLVMNGRLCEAEETMTEIEHSVQACMGSVIPPAAATVEMHINAKFSLVSMVHTMVTSFRQRSFLGLMLIVAQAFFYNAIFFSYAMVLNTFYDVPSSQVGLYEVPFCLGNFLGSAILGHFFDSIGRKPMIVGCYTMSAVLLMASAALFRFDLLNAITQTVAWCVIFFIASPSASSAYLTISEIFPLEVRAMSISVFYSAGTAVGGVSGPVLFGALVEQKQPVYVVYGYAIGSGLMVLAALAEWFWGVETAGQSLEHIAAQVTEAAPLTDTIPLRPSPSGTATSGTVSSEAFMAPTPIQGLSSERGLPYSLQGPTKDHHVTFRNTPDYGALASVASTPAD
eukprot:NODE_236_length_2238_cov_66.065372_g230_i0.p1 GENE.NODE_236_length_2238_cov_66.065372_g230_i0~~NODE_236_length_2238_cov_66.065372_g230_i0.p1  ORF type:complete len:655 (+),score=122.40 NODE_236_length_2238_cov_66.065372_g230_i0:86-2050(+)